MFSGTMIDPDPLSWHTEIVRTDIDQNGSGPIIRRDNMPERPHSRKKTIAEGTTEVKKGEQIKDSVQAGEGLAFSKEKEEKEDKEQ